MHIAMQYRLFSSKSEGFRVYFHIAKKFCNMHIACRNMHIAIESISIASNIILYLEEPNSGYHVALAEFN
jgi:hypothetical protein